MKHGKENFIVMCNQGYGTLFVVDYNKDRNKS